MKKLSKVIVVDNEAEVTSVISEYFREVGLEVRGFTDPDEALREIPLFKPDVIFLDIMMPEMDGYQFSRKLREMQQGEQIPVIFLTGKDREDDAMAFVKNGGAFFVKKPFELAELRELATLAVESSL